MTITDYKEILSYLKTLITGTEYEGHVYAVGGCVRDYVMNTEIKDIDLCVDLKNGGLLFSKWLEDNGFLKGSVVSYPSYGTAMFHLSRFPQVELESVQTRKESYPDSSCRNPETSYGSIYDDCMRRDLTINSLYYNITSEEILDLTQKGISDIENHVIRTTDKPSVIYEDDPLRILRTIRFASRYSWNIEEETMRGMREKSYRLEIISKERINNELSSMLVCDNPKLAMELLRETGSMKYVIPELEETYDLQQNLKYHFGTVWEHTLKVVEEARKNSSKLVVMMAALLHDIGKTRCLSVDENGNPHFYGHENCSRSLSRVILKRLRYDNNFTNEVSFICGMHMVTKNWMDDLSHMKLKKLRKIQYECKTQEVFNDLIDVIDADNKSHQTGQCLMNQGTSLKEFTARMVSEGDDMFGYKLPVNGNDIMKYKNIQPGIIIHKYLMHMTKLAFSNPHISKEDLLKGIKNYKPKIK